MYRLYLKRIFDLIIVILGIPTVIVPILFILPVQLLIFKGNILFIQQRSGRCGKPFYLYKFKTMVEQYDQAGNLLPEQQRINKWGKFLRTFSLDEIPQLINVLKGELSLVGPRPLLVEYIHLYNSTQFKRLDVTPGMTGLAQINGRNSLSWKHKFNYDVFYTSHVSFYLDLRILYTTMIRIINPGKNDFVIPEKFKGSNN